ncbi:MAG: fibrobacter succinogenes major paralogous domain-containing protein [Bacteroidales bacterium]|nr:fibrobacter succinogenes major paralogous domain-containing protein [Bacteroidales bacterium]MBK7627938.1 fibrobacter succinogenes major paralogous domain-containing protein [Bacteroidales bacterium]
MLKNHVLILILLSYILRLSDINAQIVKDIEGNIYSTVKIGNQIWFFDNLRSTKFNDGTQIPLVKDAEVWAALKTPAFCWLNNDPENKEIYGALYNWYTVNTRKLCPKGWHVPTDEEWAAMISSLGDPALAGAKLKESDLGVWKNPDYVGTNEYGFTALPGGMRIYNGDFPDFSNNFAVWWSSTSTRNIEAWNRGLYFNSSQVYRGRENVKSGFSVRCLKD